MTENVPLGFARHFRKSPVTDPWEPLYSRCDGDMFCLGLRIATSHCNARGMLHGGVIRWTGPVSEMDATPDPYVQQFIHGRATGPIEAVR